MSSSGGVQAPSPGRGRQMVRLWGILGGLSLGALTSSGLVSRTRGHSWFPQVGALFQKTHRADFHQFEVSRVELT